MPLSSDIISQFTKVTNDSDVEIPSASLHGTVVEYGDSVYVKLDGSDELTPVARTVEVAEGDRVEVSIKNHTAIITGNTTDPSIGIVRAGELETTISQTAEAIRLEAKNLEEELTASIELTASEIRSEVADEVAGLNSTIEQTAGNISSTVSATLVKVSVEYCSHTSSTTAPGSDANWSTSDPVFEKDKYIWSRTKYTTQGGDVTYSTPICISGMEDLSDELIELETQINQNAAAIELKASQVAVDELGNRVTQAESSITVTATEIRSEVADEVNNLESLISQTADSILLQAKNIELNGSININDKFIVDTEGTITWTADNSPVLAQYSVNGVSGWHSTPTSDDMYARYSYDGGNTWSTPIRIQGLDGKSVMAQYSVDGVSSWHDAYSASDYYVRYSYDGGETWTAAIKLRGRDVLAQYSADCSSWHDFYEDTDYYMRYSYDGGLTWGDAIRIRGEDGEDGADGTDGTSASVTYNNIKYALNQAYLAGEQGFVQIEDDRLLSPVIYGGRIVGAAMYAGESEETFISLDANGFKLYCSDDELPKARIYTDSEGKDIYLRLGAGDEKGYNYFMIRKDSSEVEMLYHITSSEAVGFRMDFNTGEIFVNGTLKPASTSDRVIATFA